MKKRRMQHRLYKQSGPQFQYRVNVAPEAWIDLPWFVLTLYEAICYLRGKGLVAKVRRIDGHAETLGNVG